MLFSFQNIEEVKDLLNQLTSIEKLELAKRIYTGRNQFEFVDSKGNLLEELKEETDLKNFYEELSDVFIRIYNTDKKVEKYLIQKLYEPCGDFKIDKTVLKKINFQELDDRCAEIFEY